MVLNIYQIKDPDIYLFQRKETACIELGKNEALIEGAVQIEEYSLVPGLGIEAANIASFTFRSRGTDRLINLLNSPHSQMKFINVALCLMSAKTPPEPITLAFNILNPVSQV